MHIYFSGIGGTAIGPLALIASQAGYEVSGSDKQDSSYIHYLRSKGLVNIHIGQNKESIAEVHSENPIDWFVYSSAVSLENPDSEEITFCQENSIKMSKRDELLNAVLSDKNLHLIAIAGTHGKTTTTAMTIWLFKQLGLPISYSLGAKISFGDMGHFDPKSKYFVYECDEFDRNFLSFQPHISLITGVSWDHHEIYPTRSSYQQAFKEFIEQSHHTLIYRDDYEYLAINQSNAVDVLLPEDEHINNISLPGKYNRLDAWLSIKAVSRLTNKPPSELISLINKFPGLQRRMEEIAPNLYSDYAHTPEKIRAAMSVALEMADKNNQSLVVVYEPLTNRRQHYMLSDYQDCFTGAKTVYWIPSYMAREDPSQRVIPPQELITHLHDPKIAVAMNRDEKLLQKIKDHLKIGDMVVAMAGGGGDSLDEWIREKFSP